MAALLVLPRPDSLRSGHLDPSRGGSIRRPRRRHFCDTGRRRARVPANGKGVHDERMAAGWLWGNRSPLVGSPPRGITVQTSPALARDRFGSRQPLGVPGTRVVRGPGDDWFEPPARRREVDVRGVPGETVLERGPAYVGDHVPVRVPVAARGGTVAHS